MEHLAGDAVANLVRELVVHEELLELVVQRGVRALALGDRLRDGARGDGARGRRELAGFRAPDDGARGDGRAHGRDGRHSSSHCAWTVGTATKGRGRVVARRVCSRSERAWAPARRDVTSRGIAPLSVGVLDQVARGTRKQSVKSVPRLPIDRGNASVKNSRTPARVATKLPRRAVGASRGGSARYFDRARSVRPHLTRSRS